MESREGGGGPEEEGGDRLSLLLPPLPRAGLRPRLLGGALSLSSG